MSRPSSPVQKSDHFDGVRYRNLDQDFPDKSLKDIARWFRTRQRTSWPKKVPVKTATPSERVSGLRITHVGHSTFLIQIDGLNVLTDPIWGKRAGPRGLVGPRRVTDPGIKFEDLPPIDVVFVSHNHYDHCDAKSIRMLARDHKPTFVTPAGNAALLQKLAPRSRIKQGDWGDRIPLFNGKLTIGVTEARHWSKRGLTDNRTALWAGCMIESGAVKVWFAGDTGFGTGAIFDKIREAYGPPDVALIPIGAYEPRWFMAPQHVNPDEAVRIFKAIGAPRALGMHWGTFQLTDEGWDQPCIDLTAALDRHGVCHTQFTPAMPGLVLDMSTPVERAQP